MNNESSKTNNDPDLLRSNQLQKIFETYQSLKLDEQHNDLVDVLNAGIHSYADNGHKLGQSVTNFQTKYPEHVDDLSVAVEISQSIRKLTQRAFALSSSHGESHTEVKKCLTRASTLNCSKLIKNTILQGNHIYQSKKLDSKPSHIPKQRSKKKSTHPQNKPQQKKSPTPVKKLHFSNHPSGLHPNDIRTLTPSSSWMLLIDETGTHFNPNNAGHNANNTGKFVAILINKNNPSIPQLPSNWHAVTLNGYKKDRILNKTLQTVLDAPVGVLGLTVESLPSASGDRWTDGVCLLTEWVLRLLPLGKKLTDLEVIVEEHAEYKAATDWKPVARLMRNKLNLHYPERAAKIKLSISVEKKNFNRFCGYADAIANTWAGNTKGSRSRLHQSGFLSSCLSTMQSRKMLGAMDQFQQGVHLSGDQWWQLIISNQKSTHASISNNFFEILGKEIENTPYLWKKYLDTVRQQMAMGAVNLNKLSAAVHWLQTYQPKETTIPPKLRLAWLTVQLANSNHHGSPATSVWQAELDKLNNQLLLECAPLVCQADLHLAVAYTNIYRFSKASHAISRWDQQSPISCGLKFWGQLASTRGQHLAFSGDNVHAIEHFQSAIQSFSSLSDPDERQKEINQTRCYLTIAMIDSNAFKNDAIRHELESVMGDINAALSHFNSQNPSPSRYSHHLLLRYLVFKNDSELITEYLKHKEEWRSGSGHPWPLIQLYRGMLLQMSGLDTEALVYAQDAISLAKESPEGSVLRLIAACASAISHSWGAVWDNPSKDLETIRKNIPNASGHIDILQSWIDTPSSPQALLESVLPFNFH